MGILNYSTAIATEKTAGEIQKRLAAAKAQAVMCEYDGEAVMIAMSFRIMTPYGLLSFRLPANTDGVFKSIEQDSKVPNRLKTRDQAARVAWRILKTWVEAQLAIVDAEMAQLAEVFLPYAQNKKGETVYQTLANSKFKMLTAPKE